MCFKTMFMCECVNKWRKRQAINQGRHFLALYLSRRLCYFICNNELILDAVRLLSWYHNFPIEKWAKSFKKSFIVACFYAVHFEMYPSLIVLVKLKSSLRNEGNGEVGGGSFWMSTYSIAPHEQRTEALQCGTYHWKIWYRPHLLMILTRIGKRCLSVAHVVVGIQHSTTPNFRLYAILSLLFSCYSVVTVFHVKIDEHN